MPFFKLYILLLVFTTVDSINIRCLFNPCSFVPDHCKNGGTCLSDKQCSPYCKCLSDFSGEHCDISKKPTTYSTLNCSVVCSTTICYNGGNCSQVVRNDSTCDSKCDCPSGYRGEFCEKRYEFCGLFHCVHGNCNNTDSTDVTCNCDDNWTGITCNIPCLKSNCTLSYAIYEGLPQKDYTFVIPVIITMAVIILIFMVITYFMWKKRMVFLMKIVFKFQNYEDDDGKEYDAFVSFRSSKSDEYWVLKTLFPMIETEMGFKLCVHFRDFVVGETVSNNIINAIEKSRRTILVLSPDYIAGEWTRMEYQVAQQEMLKRRQKIIPILFRDISNVENIDKNLTYILKSITYIKWPEDVNIKKRNHFWEQLRLTMPKKHEVNNTIEGGKVINEWTVDTKL